MKKQSVEEMVLAVRDVKNEDEIHIERLPNGKYSFFRNSKLVAKNIDLSTAVRMSNILSTEEDKD